MSPRLRPKTFAAWSILLALSVTLTSGCRLGGLGRGVGSGGRAVTNVRPPAIRPITPAPSLKVPAGVQLPAAGLPKGKTPAGNWVGSPLPNQQGKHMPVHVGGHGGDVLRELGQHGGQHGVEQLFNKKDDDRKGWNGPPRKVR
jgi:hypothetical protein